MPIGSPRPTAGRPRGAKTAPKSEPIAKVPADVRKAARKSGMTPLDYMLNVMRDDTADDARRDRMAMAAAPYVHAKPAETAKGKKEQAEEAAKTAGQGTGWGDDLTPPLN